MIAQKFCLQTQLFILTYVSAFRPLDTAKIDALLASYPDHKAQQLRNIEKARTSTLSGNDHGDSKKFGSLHINGDGNVHTNAFCYSVLKPTYEAAAVTVDLDESGEFVFRSLQCTRQIEYQPGVQLISFLVQLIQDDRLRILIAQILCSFYYRPLANPEKKSCASTCRAIWDVMHGYDSEDPLGRGDRAVLDNFLTNTFLLGGYCDFSTVYGPDDDCYGALDDDSVFRHSNDIVVYKDSCEVYPPNSICSGMFSRTFASRSFIEETSPLYHQYYPQASIDYREELFGQLKVVYPMTPILPRRCDLSLAKYACSRLYMPCYVVSLPFIDLSGKTYNVPYPLLQLSHRSLCEEYSEVCKNFIATVATSTYPQANMFKPDCDGVSNISGLYDCDGQQVAGTGVPWHPTSSTFEFIGIPVITNNFTLESQPSADPNLTFHPQYECPKPLVTPDDLNSYMLYWGSCDEPCPTLVFSEDDYVAAGNATLITAIISAICCVFLYLTWFMFAETHSNSNVLPSLFSSATLTTAILIGAIVLYPSKDSMAKQLCTRSNRQANMLEQPACAVQGFVVLFSILSLGAWWSLVSIDLFVNLVLGKKYKRFTERQQRISAILHHIWGYGIPLVLALAAAGLNSIGPADLDMAYCFIHGREYVWAPWMLTYFPLAVYMLLATLCMAWTLLHINQANLKKKQWGQYATAFMFVFIYFVMFTVIIVYRAVAFFSDPVWLESASDFIECIVLRQHLTLESCGKKPKHSPNRGAWMAVQVIMSGFGVASFIVYGMSANIYLLWLNKIGTILGIGCCIRATRLMDNRTEEEKQEDESESYTTVSLRGGLLMNGDEEIPKASRKYENEELQMDSDSNGPSDDEPDVDDNCGSQLIKGYHDDLSVTSGAAKLFFSKIRPRIPKKKPVEAQLDSADQLYFLRAEHMSRVLGDSYDVQPRTSLVSKRSFLREAELLRAVRREPEPTFPGVFADYTLTAQDLTQMYKDLLPDDNTLRPRPLRQHEDLESVREDSLVSMQERIDQARYYYITDKEEDPVHF